MNYVARPYPRYYYYSSDLPKLTRHGFAFGLLSTDTPDCDLYIYSIYILYMCICTCAMHTPEPRIDRG